MASRKKPFSAKQKKHQLQEKRERKKLQQQQDEHNNHNNRNNNRNSARDSKPQVVRTEGPLQMIREISGLRTVFAREPDELVAQRKLQAQQPLQTLPRAQWEREPLRPQTLLGMPIRPAWDASLSKQQLEAQEMDSFVDWVRTVYRNAEQAGTGPLNFFEHNLDVWRQLWRAVEMGDVLIFCCDVRWPTFTFPYALLEHARAIKKPVVLALTKTDLVPARVTLEWADYFHQTLPDVSLALTNAFAARTDTGGDRVTKRKVVKALKSNPLSKQALLDATAAALGWTGPTAEKPFYTMACVGAPNAGKSAVINMLVEAHKVAVSATPGKTKHFQTHFVSAECRLLDSPGLMFPSASPDCRTMQAVIGNYPISQLREPFSAVALLLRRIDLPRLYGLTFPFEDEDGEPVVGPNDPNHVWSPYEICAALACKRGLRLKGGALDVYRTGKTILSEALKGHLKPLYWLPPTTTTTEDGAEAGSDEAAELDHDVAYEDSLDDEAEATDEGSAEDAAPPPANVAGSRGVHHSRHAAAPEAEPAAKPAAVPLTEQELELMDLSDLRALCLELGLKTTGKRFALMDRVKENATLLPTRRAHEPDSSDE